MPREFYDFYDSPDECARVAAQRFAELKWRWSEPYQKRGHIPSEHEIHVRLLMLKDRATTNHIECGRLAYINGRFGVQRKSGVLSNYEAKEGSKC